MFQVSAKSLSLSLHLAVGIVLAVVGLELMPEALKASPPWVPLLAFVAGGAVFICTRARDRLRPGAQRRRRGPSRSVRHLRRRVDDLFSDGVMIGTGTVINPALGLLLALGQMPADVPEGLTAVATMRKPGIPRQRRILLTAAFAVPILFGAALGYLALRQAPEVITLSVLALTGGALSAVVVEDMASEAHEGDTSSLGPVFLTAGFGLFAAISVYLGE